MASADVVSDEKISLPEDDEPGADAAAAPARSAADDTEQDDYAESEQNHDAAELDGEQQQQQYAPASAAVEQQLISIGAGTCAIQVYISDHGHPNCAQPMAFNKADFGSHFTGRSIMVGMAGLILRVSDEATTQEYLPVDQRKTARRLVHHLQDNFCSQGSSTYSLLTAALQQPQTAVGSLFKTDGGFGKPFPTFCLLHGSGEHSTAACTALEKLLERFPGERDPSSNAALCFAIWEKSIANPAHLASQAAWREEVRERRKQQQLLLLSSAEQQAAATPATTSKRFGPPLGREPVKRQQPAAAANRSAAAAAPVAVSNAAAAAQQQAASMPSTPQQPVMPAQQQLLAVGSTPMVATAAAPNNDLAMLRLMLEYSSAENASQYQRMGQVFSANSTQIAALTAENAQLREKLKWTERQWQRCKKKRQELESKKKGSQQARK